MDYKELIKQATLIVNEVDPMDLIQGGAPLDEYSGEVARILAELRKQTSMQDLEEKLKTIFKPHPNRNIYAELAEKLIVLKDSFRM